MLKETLGDYQNDGYTVVRQAIPQVEMEPFLNLIREKVDTYARALMAAGKISNLYEDLPFQDRLAAIHDSKELGSLQEWQLPPIGPEFFITKISFSFTSRLGSSILFLRSSGFSKTTALPV